MIIEYRNKKIKQVCNNAHIAELEYGREMAEKIQMRIDQITAADTVEMMIRCKLGRCHPLEGNRKKQYAVDLVHPYRLVFTKVDSQIQIVCIQEIIDYH